MHRQQLKTILIIMVLTASLFCVDVKIFGSGSLSVDKPEAQIREPVTATFYMNYEDCEGGWVGVFVKGTPDDAYFWTKSVAFDPQTRQIVDNTHTVTFEQPGSYEFRLFEDYFGQRKVATAPVEVVFAPTSSILVSSEVVQGNKSVTATYTISERDGYDTGGWIGFYKVGAGDDSYITYKKTGGKSGTFEVTVPEGREEQYEFRLFMDYFGVWKLATSPAIRAAASDEELNNPVDSKARFNNLKGVVEITPDPDRINWSSANLGQVIYVGDHIQTGEDSSAVIQLEDMSTYVLPPNSEIIILTPPAKETKVGLVTGRIWNNTRKMFIDGTMQVEMGQAVAGIRGTMLVCEENQGVSTLKVIEGEVELRATSSGETQTVTAGEMLSVNSEGFGTKQSFDVEAEQVYWQGLGAPTGDEPAAVITPDALPEADAKAFYSQLLQINTGAKSYKWTVKKGSKLPSGLSLKINADSSKATISGKPARAVENAIFTIQVTDNDKNTFEKEYQLRINPAVALNTPKLPSGEAGFTLKEWTPAASGGNNNYTWTITKGTLPGGVALNPATGKIEGTPLEPGTFKFTLTVTDSIGGTASKSLSLKVYDAIEILTTVLPNGDPGITCKPVTLKAKGGASPKTWSIIEGELPAGLELNPKGVIKGKPAQGSSGKYPVTVQVSDDIGVDSRVFEITIYDPMVIDPLPDGTAGEPYNQILSVKGGSGGYKFSKVGALPKWLKLDTRTGTLSGTPDAPGSYGFSIKVTDSLKASAVQEMKIEVKQTQSTNLQCPSTDTPPVIDGILSAGEWPDPCLTAQFKFFNTITLENEIHTIVFYSMHDEVNLYIGATVIDIAFQPAVPPEQGKLCMNVFELYFDSNHDGVIEINSDIKNFWNLNYEDWYYKGNGVWSTDSLENGSGQATHTNTAGMGDYIYEFLIPLDSGDNQDLQINSNSTIGIMISFRKMWWDWDEDRLMWVYRYACWGTWPEGTLNNHFDGSKYGSLELKE